MRTIKSLGTFVAAAVLLAGCVSTTPEPTIDTTTIAAMAPACSKQPVAGAASLITDGSARNHVVMLDRAGAPFEWTEWTPEDWRPTSIADTELVACVTAEPIRDVVQVCPYYGSDITRYRVTRDVLVVEPSTGREVNSFSIVAEPRACRTTESASTTEIEGWIDHEVVAAYFTGLIEHGKYVAPASTPPSVPGGPSIEPSSPGATVIPSASAETVELRQALAAGEVTATGTGDGLERLDLDLTSKVDRPLEVTIEAGTLLEPHAKGTQTMMVVWGDSVELGPGATESVTLDVNCVEMHQDQPTSEDSFTVSTGSADADLTLLLAEPTLADATGRVRQFAIWTITNNPKRGDYVPLGSTFEVFGTRPDDEEIAQIRSLFVAAGIDISKYRALR